MSERRTTRSDSDRIECPVCGEQITDLWDYDFDHRECIEIGCPECDGDLSLCASISVTYTAYEALPTKPDTGGDDAT